MKIGLLSDTHSYIDDRIKKLLDPCDEIWHAGDIGDLTVTDQLKEIKPLRAVYGNIDGSEARLEFKRDEVFTIEGKKFWITHIGGKPGHYYPEARGKFSKYNPDIFICGHSHICKVQMDRSVKALYMNPGAAGNYGIHKVRTMLRFEVKDGNLFNLEVVELGTR